MSDRDEPGALSEAQMEIMNVVWSASESVGVAEVWKVISARRPLARNTVQTMLVRLEEKGWLEHREAGAGFRYSARRQRDSTLRKLVSTLIDTAFGGSADGLMMALLQGRSLSREEAERIRAMIDRAERRRR